MNADIPSGLMPLDRFTHTGEIKSSQNTMKSNGAAPTSELQSDADKVQLSSDTQPLETSYPFQRTQDPDLNQYIEMMKKTEELTRESELNLNKINVKTVKNRNINYLA